MNNETAISNLETIGNALEREACKPINYNTEWSHHLEQMSFHLRRMANELKDLDKYINIYE